MTNENEKYIATSSGEVIKEQLPIRNMSAKEFARQTLLSEAFVRDLLNPNLVFSKNIADGMRHIYCDTPVWAWNNIKKKYRVKLVNIRKGK